MHNNISGKHWFIRYHLYQIPFWMLYNYVWWVVAIGHPADVLGKIFTTEAGIKYSFYVFFQVLAVFFNLYWLTPRFLEKRKFGAYISFLLLTVTITSFLIIPGYYLTALVAGKTVQQYFGASACWYQFFGNALSSTLGCMTFAMSIHLARRWIRTQKREQQLEKEKLETELNFLKYQFNPHFLFNTINSIFFLIHKNPDMASASLAKFSELLRYQLYDCDEHLIRLSREVDYLENFVELERLRQNNNMEVDIDLPPSMVSGDIAPFILMTFVENAFKHVSKHTDRPNYIRIKLVVADDQLDFRVTNSMADHEHQDVVHYGGIGLKNVQRRLDLVYPGQYQLDIHDNRQEFQIRFRLDLFAQTIHRPLFKTA